MDIVTFFLGGVWTAVSLLLLLFIPGLLISLVFYPRFSDIPIMERLAYATVLSIGSAVACVLFMDLALGIYTTQRNIFFILVVFSLLLTQAWLFRYFFIKYSVTERIAGLIDQASKAYILPAKARLIEKLKRPKKAP